jgi:hypothetical protein
MSEPVVSDWSRPPHCFLGLGSPDDPIPLVPPADFAGKPRLYLARTKADMKNIPDWELLTYFLRGPDLVFARADEFWFRERWERFYRLRRAARKAAADGSRVQFDRLVSALRFRWRVLVQRSIGLRLMGGEVIRWR